MKRILFLTLFTFCFWNITAQEADTTKVEQLDAVFLKAVRVKPNAPITHTNVDKSELANRNLGQDIPQLLNFLPAVVTTSDAGTGIGYTGIRVRGSDATRINVTLNGIPYNDAESQGTFWVDLPDFASSVENLQLQRGVGTSTNGSGAFGASLNIRTEAISKNAFAEIANTIGSFNTRKHTVKFSTGILKDAIEVGGRFSQIQSDGYIDRASANLKGYFLYGAYKTDKTLIKALVFGGNEITYQSWFGVDAQTLAENRTFNPAGQRFDDFGNPEGFHENQVDNYSQDHYQLLWNQKYNAQWSSQVALNYTYGRGFFEEYIDDWFTTQVLFSNESQLDFYGIAPVMVGNQTITQTDLVRRRWLDNDFYALSANVNYKKQHLEKNFGLFHSRYLGDHFGEVIWARFAGNSELGDTYYFGNGDKKETTIFSKTDWQINSKVNAFIDLQGRFVNYTTTGQASDTSILEVDEAYAFFNPKMGLSYQLNRKNQLYLSYGHAHREPRRSDFQQGIFTPEKLDDYEIGWRYKTAHSTLQTNAYFMWYKDQLVLTGALDDVGAPIRATSGKSYRLGVELDAAVLLSKKWQWQSNLALSDNRNVDFVASLNGTFVNLGNTRLSFSPSVIAGNMFKYTPTTNFNIALLSKYVGSQFMGNIDSNTSKLPAYHTHDINLVYTIDTLPFAETLTFSALVNNVLNRKYVSNGYFFTYDDDFTNPGTITTIEGAGFYPQAGIHVLLGATLRF